MAEKPVLLDLDLGSGLATITLNRPEHLNALNEAMVAPLVAALKAVAEHNDVRCVILAGAGDHFMAGGDLRNFSGVFSEEPEGRREHFDEMIKRLHPAILSIHTMDKPVIAQVQGAAAGFGMSLALATDLIIASEDAYFTMAYCLIGTSPDGGGTFHLPRHVGLKAAMELALLGDRIDAQTALQKGLVNRVVGRGDLTQDCRAWAERLANGPPKALARTKALLRQSSDNSLGEHLDLERQAFAVSASEADFEEGVRAFLEKRQARFTGN
ncbi:MAG: enoyl-CoA hydratase-related protein [Pseudomonadota bacterium]